MTPPANINHHTMLHNQLTAGYAPQMQPQDSAIRTKDIEREMNELAEAAQTNRSLVDAMAQKLNPLIAPNPPANKPDKCAPNPTVCPLASMIRDHREAIQYSNSVIRELLEVVEL